MDAGRTRGLISTVAETAREAQGYDGDEDSPSGIGYFWTIWIVSLVVLCLAIPLAVIFFLRRLRCSEVAFYVFFAYAGIIFAWVVLSFGRFW